MARRSLKDQLIEGIVQIFDSRRGLVNDLEEITAFFEDKDLAYNSKPMIEIGELKAVIEGIDTCLMHMFGDKTRMIEHHENGELEGLLKNIFLREDITASEADKRWGLPKGTVRQSCNRGKLKEYITKGYVRQSGKVWLVTEHVMREVFGPPKKDRPTN